MARIEYNKDDGSGGGGYTVYPQGTYDLQVVDVEQKTSGAGNPQLQIKCEIASGDYEGKKVTLWLSLLPQAAWRLNAWVKALGIDSEEHDDLRAFDSDDALDCYFRAEAKERTYNGKDKNEWENFSPSPLSAPPTTAAAAAPQTVPSGKAAPKAAPQAAPAAAAAPQAAPTGERRSRRLA